MAIVTSTLLSAAAQAAGGQQYPAGALYLVATPIGNLADLSLRAIHTLALVDVVACEDTRNTGHLLRHLGLDKSLLAVHEHNEMQAADQVLALLSQGQRVAYVSDAGTPAISDPGAVLCAAAHQAGFRVVPLPGASSAAAALSVAGDVRTQGFRFIGFLPAKGQERRAALDEVVAAPAQAQTLFEAPHRIEERAQALAERAVSRTVTVCRELTKQFETVHTLPSGELPAWLATDEHRRRGEFVLVLHAAPVDTAKASADSLPEGAQRTLKVLLAELSVKQASTLAAELTGVPRKALYAQALAWKKDDDTAM